MEAKVFKTRMFNEASLAKSSLSGIFRSVCQAHGLTVLQFLLLKHIEDGIANCVQGIVNEMELNQSNVSVMCKKLERSGFITRQRCDTDERKYILDLTEKGRDALRAIDEHFKRVDSILKNYPQEKLDFILAALKELSDLLAKLESELSGRDLTNA